MAIKLYTYWRSSAAYRVRIALNLKGIDYEPVPVSLQPGDDEHRSDAYRAINPQMLVPFFDDGKVAIGQSMAIVEYLEEVYPDPSILPGDSVQRARARQAALAIACATRHLGIAVLVAAAVPGQNTGVLVVAYLVASIVVSIPYIHWRKRFHTGM